MEMSRAWDDDFNDVDITLEYKSFLRSLNSFLWWWVESDYSVRSLSEIEKERERERERESLTNNNNHEKFNVEAEVRVWIWFLKILWVGKSF